MPTSSIELMLFGCLCFGAAAAILALAFRTAAAEEGPQEWRYSLARLEELRAQSVWFRLFEPLVSALGRLNANWFADQFPAIRRELLAAGHSRAWTAEEWLAVIEIQSILISVPLTFVWWNLMGGYGLFLGVMQTIVIAFLLRRRLARQAALRLWRIKVKLPYFLDLLTLLMEAGSTFLNGLKEAVHEFRQQPIGVEFGRVLGEMNMGKSRITALEGLRERLQDDELTSIIGAMIQGEQLGSPLAHIFRAQADVLRIKRTQRAETIAGEAGVKMLLPAILVMGSTVIVILGPFILNFIYGGLFGE
ncbi:type II secretion system F family protein [Planctomyces sp. SH-PL14]|uniref:type II secretion system F family protein n=1 Tax=Planctomyces sp. SH-PL14 TaxID=1632864 RepID=UPI00078D2C8F|nr:type II secretion system F family protein [Planctomyces sp. SH-PL14]AMV18510.1 Bacterial type II secretion system protein F domain protein [Planctomyces sp. SH-PL14]